jgi:oligopeptide/dipeptide ABC transporter ATP-binding protein
MGSTAEVLGDPRHPYTRGLVEALPVADPSVERHSAPLLGEPPSPADPPAGCRFHPRCPLAEERCRGDAPPQVELSATRWAECHVVGG